MGTNLKYNGVELHNVATTEWQQEVMLDESGTDLLYTRHRITVEGILHVQAGDNCPAWILPSSGSYSSAGHAASGSIEETMAKVQALLSRPRCELEITINAFPPAGGSSSPSAKTIFKCKPATTAGGQDLDCANGPIPKSVTIKQILSNKVFTVAFTIECCRLESGKPTGTTMPPVVLNNRWSVSEAMDANFFTTRTIAGKMKLANSLSSGHLYKYVVVPGLEKGFKRESLEYSVSPNGLECDYTITDKQIHWAPPWPATNMEGTHSSSLAADGMNAIEDFYVRLDGSPKSDKRMLIQQAMAVTMNRLKLTGAGKAKFAKEYIPENITITEHFGPVNACEVRARIRYTPEKVMDYVAPWNNELGMPLVPKTDGAFAGHPYDKELCRVPALYGETLKGDRGDSMPAVLTMLSCYLQVPEGVHNIGQWVNKAKGENNPPYPENPNYPRPDNVYQVPYEVPSTSTSSYSSAAKEAPYTNTRLEINYYTSASNVALPKGGSGTASSGGGFAPGTVGGTSGSQSSNKETTSQVSDVAGEQASVEIVFDFERHGKLPEIPARPKTINLAKNLTGKRVWSKTSTVGPTLNGGGAAQIYRIFGTAIYALNRPIEDNENITLGALPFTSATAQGNIFTLAQVEKKEYGLEVPQASGNQPTAEEKAAGNADNQAPAAGGADGVPPGNDGNDKFEAEKADQEWLAQRPQEIGEGNGGGQQSAPGFSGMEGVYSPSGPNSTVSPTKFTQSLTHPVGGLSPQTPEADIAAQMAAGESSALTGMGNVSKNLMKTALDGIEMNFWGGGTANYKPFFDRSNPAQYAQRMQYAVDGQPLSGVPSRGYQVNNFGG